MKHAFYVLGPESSGTKMLTKAFISAGAHGEDGHQQGMDDLDFSNKPNTIVYRNSVPHHIYMPPIQEICEKMEHAGYSVTIVVIDRQDIFLELSQVKREHQSTILDARDSITRARDYILEQLEAINVAPILVQYEHFVDLPHYRKAIFESFGLPEPNMEFYNANKVY